MLSYRLSLDCRIQDSSRSVTRRMAIRRNPNQTVFWKSLLESYPPKKPLCLKKNEP
jgi:hypothetical protein